MDPVKVFIVDDSPHVVEVLSELLREEGRVDVCGSAATASEAIAAIDRVAPEVIIADLQLREGSGFDVLEAVRGAGAGSRAAGVAKPLFVLFSNHVAPELARHALDRGADHFLDKTSDHGRLIELIGERVAARQG